jgi:hypothetical protein
MTPEVIEGIKAGFSLTAAICLAIVGGYCGYQFLTACDNIAAIKRKVCEGRNEYE